MNRRNAISNIVILSIGAVVLPSCGQTDKAALVKLKNLSLTGGEEKMMQQLTDTILPLKTPGDAASLNPYAFTLMMVDDCYEPASQQKFIAGLKAFDQLAKNKYGQSFTACLPAQKTAWLFAVENKTGMPEELLYFYATTKRHTVQAFTSTKEYMTNVLKYKMVPGSNFKGCVPVRTSLNAG